MQNAIATFSAALVTGAMMLASAVPAQAQRFDQNYSQRDRVIQTYCQRNPNDRDCRGYWNGGWGNNDYNRFYNQRRNNLDSLATGIFGFTFGAILGSALAGGNNQGNVGRPNNSNAHIQACFARYKSYDVGTDSYMGYDGYRHRCNL